MPAPLARGIGFMLFWLALLPSWKWPDLAVGALAAACATLASLRLLPPGAGRVRLLAMVALIPRFLAQSLIAGFDVARRALSPRMPLATGFVDYRTGFARGSSRNQFATITSLMPGTLPCGETADTIEFHCLDTSAPVVESLATEERLLANVLLPAPADGGHV
jgi:multicomponent Na+:H+ antiporter subunit E